MPPGTGDIQLTLSQKVPVTGAVIVTTPQDIALLDAKKGLKMFEKVGIPILGIVENMGTHVCSNCGHEEHIFGAGGGERMAKEYGVEILGSLPLDIAIREQADSGAPTVVSDPDSRVAEIYRAIARKVAISYRRAPARHDLEVPEHRRAEHLTGRSRTWAKGDARLAVSCRLHLVRQRACRGLRGRQEDRMGQRIRRAGRCHAFSRWLPAAVLLSGCGSIFQNHEKRADAQLLPTPGNARRADRHAHRTLGRRAGHLQPLGHAAQ